ncbi:phosphatidylserine decarboxylase [candidate division TM6 bacterium RIFCSPHIGHO2_12_FULL_32_22]|nr:MAG: phosphatidylserine decarboxylase [candidate division TM6 bacterium RIFCSPHIGHO2_12_FULL_32_22]
MINFITSNLLWSCGWPVTLFLGFLLLLSLFFHKLLFIFVPLFLFAFYFFRNPERICKATLTDSSVLVCPSDGKVLSVEKGDFDDYKQKVTIFLSPLDVHVNWIPYSGIIDEINYRPGKFLMAFEPKSSEFNERNDIVLLLNLSGHTERACNASRSILVRQIAGFIARRICCWVKSGESVNVGQKYGMIRFGSRIEVFLPENVDIEIKEGQKILGGETILGRFR